MARQRKLKLTRSFWMRLLAVGVFVGLGTYAVIRSTSQGRLENTGGEVTQTNSDSASDSESSPGESTFLLNPETGSNPHAVTDAGKANGPAGNSSGTSTGDSEFSLANSSLSNAARDETRAKPVGRNSFSLNGPPHLEDGDSKAPDQSDSRARRPQGRPPVIPASRTAPLNQFNEDRNNPAANSGQSEFESSQTSRGNSILDSNDRQSADQPRSTPGSQDRLESKGGTRPAPPPLRPGQGDPLSNPSKTNLPDESSSGNSPNTDSESGQSQQPGALNIKPLVISQGSSDASSTTSSGSPAQSREPARDSSDGSFRTESKNGSRFQLDRQPTGRENTDQQDSRSTSPSGNPAGSNQLPPIDFNRRASTGDSRSPVGDSDFNPAATQPNSHSALAPRTGSSPSDPQLNGEFNARRRNRADADANPGSAFANNQGSSNSGSQAAPPRFDQNVSTGNQPDPGESEGEQSARNTGRGLPGRPLASRDGIGTRNTPGKPEREGVQTPAITIQKLTPPEVQVNRPSVFSILVKNTGRVPANQVTVFDEVPEGTEFIESEPAPSTHRSGQLSWDLATLAPGEERMIRLKLLPQRPGEIGSVAQVTFSASASAKTTCTQPKLELTAQAPDEVLIGQEIILDITVKNTGTGKAESVLIQEDVPEALEFATGQRQLEYPVGVLQPGQSRNVKLRLRAARIGSARNLLVAHGAGNLAAQKAVDITVVAPKLVTSAQGPKRRFVNRAATHQFTVSNTGTAPATNLDMVAKLPPGLKFVETNNKGIYNAQSHSVSWSLAELRPGQTGRIELETLPIASGQQTIEFTTSGDLQQRSQSQHTTQVSEIVEVVVEIDDTQDVIEVGSQTTYAIKIANQGTAEASNVQLQLSFPDGIRPTKLSPEQAGEIRDQQVVFAPIPKLEPRQQLGFSIEAQGMREGDHVVVATLKTAERTTPESKEETTRVYVD